jgi:hypothetical protein
VIVCSVAALTSALDFSLPAFVECESALLSAERSASALARETLDALKHLNSVLRSLPHERDDVRALQLDMHIADALLARLDAANGATLQQSPAK